MSPATLAMDKPEQKRRAILGIHMCTFCLLCAQTIPRPLMAGLNFDFGGTASSLGTARTLSQLHAFLLSLVISPMVNAIGTKKALIVFCVCSGIGTLLCSLASSRTMLYSGIFLLGSTLHSQTVGKTVIADICTADELPHQFGKLGMAGALTFIAGPVISLILTQTIGCVFIAGCLAALTATGVAMSLQVTTNISLASDEKTGPILSNVELLPYMIVSIVCSAPFAVLLFSSDSYLVSRFNMGPRGIALITLAVAISFAISQGVLFTKLHKRFGSVRLLFCSGAAVSVPLLFVDYIESIPLFTMVLVCSVVAMGCCRPTIDVLMVELTSPNKSRGTALASNIQSMNGCLVPIASGYMLDAGLPLFRITGLLCAAGAALGFFVLPKISQKARTK